MYYARHAILLALGTALLVGAVSPAAGQTRTRTAGETRFDGRWSVLIVAEVGGCCQGTYRYGIQIVRGQIVYQGNNGQFSGRVDRNGRVGVNVTQGNQRASGSGRLSATSGTGFWTARAQTADCGGRWQAERI